MASKQRFADIDRINALPDPLLCHILSFVPTKQSVQTTVLSKRWRHVWTDLPNIDIDDSIMNLKPITLATAQSVYTSFTNFMTKVFNRGKKAPLCKFALTSSKFDVLHVNEWILAATKPRVEEIALSIAMEGPFKMSCGLFAYQELVTLKLGKNFVLKVPNGMFFFPSLKKLHLHYVVFDDSSIHKLTSFCPVLEELHVEHCSTKMWDTVVFSAPNLKIFVINTLIDYDYSCDYKLIVDAPSLEVLNYSGYLATKGYCFKNLNSLTHATLDVGVDKERDHIHCALELFRGVANAGTIILTGYTLEVLHLYLTHINDDFVFFNKLSKLQLGGNSYCGLVLPQLLYFSPNLQVLVIDEDPAMRGDSYDLFWDWEWDFSVDGPERLSPSLKVVEIWGIDGHRQYVGVSAFIRYVLLNAKLCIL